MSKLSTKRVLAIFAAGDYNDCLEDDKDDDYQQHSHQHHH